MRHAVRVLSREGDEGAILAHNSAPHVLWCLQNVTFGLQFGFRPPSTSQHYLPGICKYSSMNRTYPLASSGSLSSVRTSSMLRAQPGSVTYSTCNTCLIVAPLHLAFGFLATVGGWRYLLNLPTRPPGFRRWQVELTGKVCVDDWCVTLSCLEVAPSCERHSRAKRSLEYCMFVFLRVICLFVCLQRLPTPPVIFQGSGSVVRLVIELLYYRNKSIIVPSFRLLMK